MDDDQSETIFLYNLIINYNRLLFKNAFISLVIVIKKND